MKCWVALYYIYLKLLQRINKSVKGKQNQMSLVLETLNMLVADLDPWTDAFTKAAASGSTHTCSSLILLGIISMVTKWVTHFYQHWCDRNSFIRANSLLLWKVDRLLRNVHSLHEWSYHFFFFLMLFIYFERERACERVRGEGQRERERDRETEREGERREERIPRRLCSTSSKPHSGLDLMGWKIMIWAKTRELDA